MKNYLKFLILYFKVFGLSYFFMNKPNLYQNFPFNTNWVKVKYEIIRYTEISTRVIEEGELEGTAQEVYLQIRKKACKADWNTESFFGVGYKVKEITNV